MRLNELFTGKKDWEWAFRGSEEVVADFKVGNIPYRFTAYSVPEDPSDWEIEFRDARQDAKSAFGITGSGNAAQVFGTVVDILREFLASRPDVTILRFSAEEPSRQALYKRMLSRLLPKWDVRVQHNKYIIASLEEFAYWVYSMEFPEVPAVRIRAASSVDAEKEAMKLPQFKDADPMGMAAVTQYPKDHPGGVDNTLK